MKKILIFLWLSLFIQCHTQNKVIPKTDSSFEKFNIENFNKNAVRGMLEFKDNKISSFQDFQSPGYRERNYSLDSFFKINKFFFNNGNIEKKGALFNIGSQVGIWYYFDEAGRLIKEENTDEGYAFTPEDIIKYCKKNNIELSKGYHERDGYQTSVYKNELDGKKVWLISYLASLNKQEKEVKLTLDGQTGKVIKREEFPYDSY
ncbi:hypothetical protein VUJ46_13795 [Chryseobacterium sp. MYb264]|uniref:hypothetical protein n=1 Tax=Chryseobacterium sp. MYb264 TaxID=2745153 RepID=UPI002E13C0F3|nr:hypothetical protein VUJ46_13795 [Chryseobacterium sp. MYb264]